MPSGISFSPIPCVSIDESLFLLIKMSNFGATAIIKGMIAVVIVVVVFVSFAAQLKSQHATLCGVNNNSGHNAPRNHPRQGSGYQ
eukprot:scaffold2435_cov92-Skeletonema_dohrnii-CCMP3373.AAC.11